MSLHDPSANFETLMCLDPVVLAAAATTDCASIDTEGWRWATFIIQLGADGGTVTAASAKVTGDPATGGAFATDITGAVFNATTLLAHECIVMGRIDLHKLSSATARWLRVEITLAGTVTGTPASCCVILSDGVTNTIQTNAFDFAV